MKNVIIFSLINYFFSLIFILFTIITKTHNSQDSMIKFVVGIVSLNLIAYIFIKFILKNISVEEKTNIDISIPPIDDKEMSEMLKEAQLEETLKDDEEFKENIENTEVNEEINEEFKEVNF
ncbi:hypothetical protein WG909_00760 [Peptostreptococcaceae bacterium AGR-M142]